VPWAAGSRLPQYRAHHRHLVPLVECVAKRQHEHMPRPALAGWGAGDRRTLGPVWHWAQRRPPGGL